jgi:hypothetical protein
MDGLFKNAPDIIRAAATNTLSFAALIVLIIGTLAFIHFRHSSELARVTVFILTGIAFLITLVVIVISTIIQGEFDHAKREQLDSPTPQEIVQPTTPSHNNVPVRAKPAAPLSPSSRFAKTCVTPWLKCSFEQPFLQKGDPCTCRALEGLMLWEGVAE